MYFISDEKVPYFAGKSYQAVLKPYKTEKISALFLLPNESGEEAMKTSVNEFLAAYSGLTDSFSRPQKVDLAVPRFKLDIKLNLKDQLVALGVTDAFGKDAEFANMM